MRMATESNSTLLLGDQPEPPEYLEWVIYGYMIFAAVTTLLIIWRIVVVFVILEVVFVILEVVFVILEVVFAGFLLDSRTAAGCSPIVAHRQ